MNPKKYQKEYKVVTFNEIASMIKADEGYRDKVYLDTVGVPTLGWGHALHEGSPVPESVSEVFFKMDLDEAIRGADLIIQENNLSNNLNPARRYVLINMVFNMGVNGVRKFKKMLSAISDGLFDQAADEMLDSKWAQQVGHRAKRLATIMREGHL